MSHQINESNQSQTATISCENLAGIDLEACLALQETVRANNIDLNTLSGAQTAYYYHQVKYDMLSARVQ